MSSLKRIFVVSKDMQCIELSTADDYVSAYGAKDTRCLIEINESPYQSDVDIRLLGDVTLTLACHEGRFIGGSLHVEAKLKLSDTSTAHATDIVNITYYTDRDHVYVITKVAILKLLLRVLKDHREIADNALRAFAEHTKSDIKMEDVETATSTEELLSSVKEVLWRFNTEPGMMKDDSWAEYNGILNSQERDQLSQHGYVCETVYNCTQRRYVTLIRK